MPVAAAGQRALLARRPHVYLAGTLGRGGSVQTPTPWGMWDPGSCKRQYATWAVLTSTRIQLLGAEDMRRVRALDPVQNNPIAGTCSARARAEQKTEMAHRLDCAATRLSTLRAVAVRPLTGGHGLIRVGASGTGHSHAQHRTKRRFLKMHVPATWLWRQVAG